MPIGNVAVGTSTRIGTGNDAAVISYGQDGRAHAYFIVTIIIIFSFSSSTTTTSITMMAE
jgi:hypothetical protein